MIMKKVLVELEDELYERLENLNIRYKIDKSVLIEQAIKKSLPTFEDEFSKIFVASKSDSLIERDQVKIQEHRVSTLEPTTLEIKLRQSHISSGFIYIPKKYRKYFPETTLDHIEDKMFIISTDYGEIKTHLEPAFRIPHITEWFKAHKNELKSNMSIFIDVIEPFKKYQLKI